MPALEELALANIPSPRSRFAGPVPNQRAAVQIAIKARLRLSGALRRENRNAATAQTPGVNWSLIAFYENSSSNAR